jgi:hypothetical protein
VRKVPRHLRTLTVSEIMVVLYGFPETALAPERSQRAECVVETIEGYRDGKAYQSFFGKLRTLDGPPEVDISSLVNKRIGRHPERWTKVRKSALICERT